MKVLCLHGKGSNSEIFEAQLNNILQSLPSFECVFLDALFECPPDKQLSSFYEGPFYDHGDTTFESLIQTYEHIIDAIEDEDRFDGIIAFSQGAAAAATVMLYHQHLHPNLSPLCDFAIFFNGTSAWDIAGCEGVKKALKAEEKCLPQIPTVHVVGKVDTYRNESLSLYRLADKRHAYLLEHAGGHIIPKDRCFTMRLQQTIEKAIYAGSM